MNLSRRLLFAVVAVAFGFATPSAGAEPAPAAKESAPYRYGVAKIDVTPSYPVRMSGYSNRKSEFEGVAQPVFCRGLALQSGDEKPVVFVSVDSLGITAAMTADVARRLQEAHGIPPQNVSVCATHTHSAPATTAARLIFQPPLPAEHARHIEQYTADLTRQLGDVAFAAVKKMAPARLSWATGKATFAVNRRVLKDKTWTGFGVTPTGPVDHGLPVLFVHEVSNAAGGEQEKLRAVLLNYACHCTTLGGSFNQVHGDWAGCAAEQIEREHDGVTTLVCIGCGADANPNPRQDDLAVPRRHGDEVAREVARLLKAKRTPITGPIATRRETFDLPLAKLPTADEYRARLTQTGRPVAWHAQAQLDRLSAGEKLRTAVPYSVQSWTLGDGPAMVFLPGEVVVDYQLRLKRELDAGRLWINAYANDVPCYIPSKRVLAEGGYEADSSMYYYDQPTRFAPEIEDLIVERVRGVVPRSYDAATRFAPDVARIEARDKTNGIPQDPILFIGSSTIVRWNLAKGFSDLPVVNHGFGGSRISDSVFYFDRLVTPVAPKQIVFFAGGNDLNMGKTPEQVFHDFKKFAALVREKLPRTRLTYLAITPTPKRWSQIDATRAFHTLVEAEIARMNTPLVEFVPTEKKFLDADGQPQPKLFVADQLHLNDDGYAILVDVLRPYLK